MVCVGGVLTRPATIGRASGVGQSHSAAGGVLHLGVVVARGRLDGLEGLRPAGRSQRSQQGQLGLAPGPGHRRADGIDDRRRRRGGREREVSRSGTVLLAFTPLTL